MRESTKPRLVVGISWANRRKDSIGFFFLFHQTCIHWKARRCCGVLFLFVCIRYLRVMYVPSSVSSTGWPRDERNSFIVVLFMV